MTASLQQYWFQTVFKCVHLIGSKCFLFIDSCKAEAATAGMANKEKTM